MIARRLQGGLVLTALLVLPLTGSAQGLDRSKPPVLGPPPSVSLPPIITRELPNGLKLMIVEHHELPVASFVLVAESGGTIDPARCVRARGTTGPLHHGCTNHQRCFQFHGTPFSAPRLVSD